MKLNKEIDINNEKKKTSIIVKRFIFLLLYKNFMT